MHRWTRRSLALLAACVLGTLAGCGARRSPPPGAPSAPAPPLSGLVVLVDPGHGGIDPGAIGHGVVEKDVNLAVALALAADLRAAGAIVYLTRQSDTEPGVVPGHRNYRQGLRARRAQAGRVRARMVLSIHSNKVYAPAAHGPTVFYHRDVAASVPLATAVAAQLRALAGRCAVFANSQLVLQTPGVPAINVELGFLSNRRDAGQLADAAYQRQLAAAIATGVRGYWAQRYGPPRAGPSAASGAA